jgi:hypothetical protein
LVITKLYYVQFLLSTKTGAFIEGGGIGQGQVTTEAVAGTLIAMPKMLVAVEPVTHVRLPSIDRRNVPYW